MRVFIGLLLAALLAFNGVLALPARSPNDDAEVISVPRRTNAASASESDEDGFTNFKGVIDTGSGYPFLQPHPPPFSFNLGLFDVFDDLVRRLGASFGSNGDAAGQDGDSNESGIGAFGFKGLGVDGKKGNTTSTVKVVDGHKVEVNETVYGDSGESFRVRIVNIRPLESGEEVEETVKTGEEKPREPVTSAPKIKPREDVDDSDERREPLERDNEIRVNADEQKILQAIKEIEEKEEEIAADSTLLPSTTIVEATTTPTFDSNQDNSNDNLNAAFVSDNRKEDEQNLNGKGNIEAETNKPTDDEINVQVEKVEKEEQKVEEDLSKMLKNYDENDETTTTVNPDEELEVEVEQTNAATTDDVNYNAKAGGDGDNDNDNDDVVADSVAAAAEDASLTIENNEKTETNDNFNESSVGEDGDGDDAVNAASAVEMTKDLNKLTLHGDDVAELEKSSSTFDEQQEKLNGEVLLVAPVADTSAIETFDVDLLNSENVEVLDAAVNAALRYADLTKKQNKEEQREHLASSSSSSSDDEGVEVEMNPTFNSEWEHIAEELAQTNDQNNDLSNDIDVYSSVPIDLSNDIAVNDIAAAQADFPINPNAEFIDVVDNSGAGSSASVMPQQFEKLSMSTGYQQQQEQPLSMEMLATPAK